MKMKKLVQLVAALALIKAVQPSNKNLTRVRFLDDHAPMPSELMTDG